MFFVCMIKITIILEHYYQRKVGSHVGHNYIYIYIYDTEHEIENRIEASKCDAEKSSIDPTARNNEWLNR
jgi:hypothetical protein